MDIVIKISQFLLSLSILIVLHELGHFIPAKLFKTKVEKFYLFFDIKYSLFKKKIGETVYGIGWLPLGGYVKIAGMIDESMDKEQMAKPPQPWEFRSKPAWQRLIIMLGGVTVNFILAIFIYIGLSYVYGDRVLDNADVVDGIYVQNTVADKVGLKTGDKILKIDGRPVGNFNDVPEKVLFSEKVEVDRNGEKLVIDMPIDFLSQMIDSKEKSFIDVRMPFVVAQVPDSSHNLNKGLRKGDLIVDLDNKSTRYIDLIKPVLADLKGKTVNARILRNKEEINLSLEVNQEGQLGIVYPSAVSTDDLDRLGFYDFREINYSFLEAFPAGLRKTKDKMLSYFKQVKAIFTPSTGAYKGVGGFYAIYNIFPATWSWEYFWGITAFLSIMLGVLNLLPIPALDGGHVMFLLYEMVTQRKPSEQFLEKAQMVGFFILIALVLFANGNDIIKAVFN